MSSMSALPSVPSKMDLVYELLRERILSGELRPGDRLNMDALAKELGVSKIPVREAVMRLESLKLVVSRAHAGPTVASINETELQGVYLARQSLEPTIASLAAERLTAQQQSELVSIDREMREALARNELDRLSDLNHRFHMLQAKASGYSVFEELTEITLLSVRRYRVVQPLDVASWESVLVEHGAILRALEQRDGSAAAAAALAHAASQGQKDVSASGRVSD